MISIETYLIKDERSGTHMLVLTNDWQTDRGPTQVRRQSKQGLETKDERRDFTDKLGPKM